MKTSSLAFKATLACALTLATGASYAADPAATRAKIAMALQGDIRSEAEVARDANRKPAEVLEFFGLEDDMKVLEISPATGYWSKFVGRRSAQTAANWLCRLASVPIIEARS